jgi:ADP-ribose pyrophosphatase
VASRARRPVESRYVYTGRTIRVREDKVQREDGSIGVWSVVEHPGAVVIVPLDGKGNVLLVRQPRYALDNQLLLELPAGTLEPGESPEATAWRELHEETGHDAEEMVHLGGFYSAPGFCTEYLHLFVARNVHPLEDAPSQDEDEDITLVPTPLSAIPGLIQRGEIHDAKSVAGLLRALFVDKQA